LPTLPTPIKTSKKAPHAYWLAGQWFLAHLTKLKH
jgi:hypothetical protein